MATRRQLEEELVRYSRRLLQNGWVANHDGNVTAKLSDGRILATPTGVSKGDVERSWLIVVDDSGQVLSGTRKPFSELELHLYIYRQRPDVRAVVHSHAPNATALAVAGQAVQSTILAEPVVSLGREVPLVPYAAPKSAGVTLNLGPWIQDVDAVTLENHGVLTWGPNLETAYLRMELVEHLAGIQCTALRAGGVRSIPEEDIERLLEARTKAGLGRAGREKAAAEKAAKEAEGGDRAAKHGSKSRGGQPAAAAAGSGDDTQLGGGTRAVIHEEVRRAIRR